MAEFHYKTAASYNWDTIWGITSLVSVGLMLAFAMLFREDGNQRNQRENKKNSPADSADKRRINH